MDKTEDKGPETLQFPASSHAKATDHLHVVVHAAEQWAGVLGSVTPGTEEAQKMLKTVLENTTAGGIELLLKTIGALRANTDADLTHLQALLGAKLPSQVIALQSTFLRKRVELFVEQAKEFRALGTKVVVDAAKPSKNNCTTAT